MSRYSAVLAGGAVVGQLVGGLLISANLFNSGWRPVFLVNVPIGVLLLVAGVRALPHGQGEPGRTLDLPGLALLTPAVLAFVLPLVLGQPEHWPAWGWVLMAASVPLVAAFAVAERRVAGTGGTPLIPGRVLRVPGVPVAIAALLVVMTIFSGFFFILALHLQDGLGYSPLRAGLTFAPAAAAFALVSLNWRRLPARSFGVLIVGGFVLFAAAMAGLAWVLRDGGSGGVALYLIGALSGAGMAAAFSPLMTRVLLRVPVELAADATGVVVTVNQLGLLLGVATFGTLYLNLARPLRARRGGRGGRVPARLRPRRGDHLPRPGRPGRARRAPRDRPPPRAPHRQRLALRAPDHLHPDTHPRHFLSRPETTRSHRGSLHPVCGA